MVILIFFNILKNGLIVLVLLSAGIGVEVFLIGYQVMNSISFFFFFCCINFFSIYPEPGLVTEVVNSGFHGFRVFLFFHFL